MQVVDLVNKSVKEMTEEELVERLKALKSMRVVEQSPAKPKSTKGHKSNADKQIEDLFSKLTPEKREKLAALLKGV